MEFFPRPFASQNISIDLIRQCITFARSGKMCDVSCLEHSERMSIVTFGVMVLIGY